MGFTSTEKSMFDPNMPQTPENVAKVLDVAGWTVGEAAAATGINMEYIMWAFGGYMAMPKDDWRLLLDKAGRRAFDHDEGEA